MICLKKSFAWREIVKIIAVKKLQRKSSNLTWNPAIILFLSSDKASHSSCHSSYRSFRPHIQYSDGHSLVWQHPNWLSAHGPGSVNTTGYPGCCEPCEAVGKVKLDLSELRTLWYKKQNTCHLLVIRVVIKCFQVIVIVRLTSSYFTHHYAMTHTIWLNPEWGRK